MIEQKSNDQHIDPLPPLNSRAGESVHSSAHQELCISRLILFSLLQHRASLLRKANVPIANFSVTYEVDLFGG